MFSREADDAVQAIVSAIEDTEAAGMRVTGVTEDRVTIGEIAERAKVTSASAHYWVSGERGPGSFPEPVIRRQRASLYSWAEVSRAGTAERGHSTSLLVDWCPRSDAARQRSVWLARRLAPAADRCRPPARACRWSAAWRPGRPSRHPE
jgi:hypothetical protein